LELQNGTAVKATFATLFELQISMSMSGSEVRPSKVKRGAVLGKEHHGIWVYYATIRIVWFLQRKVKPKGFPFSVAHRLG